MTRGLPRGRTLLITVLTASGAAFGCGGAGESAPPAEPPRMFVSPPERRSVEAKGDAAPAGRSAALPTGSPREVEMDPRLLDRVDMVVFGGIADGAAPGAALAVARHDRLVRSQGYGRTDWSASAPQVTDSTIYDLASLTKVIGTTTAVMLLVDEGLLDLDAPLSRYLSAWGGTDEKERVTPRHLLTHTSGLPAFRPLWRESRGRHEYLRRIAAIQLERRPGAAMEYSDLGMILLALAVERITGRPLDVFLEERVFGPLGMRDTGYSPLQTGWRAKGYTRARVEAEILPRIAPTEVDTVFRNAHVHGVVHDENAYAMGGVAGHAGLFSSTRDLTVFAEMLLNGGRFRGQRILRKATVRAFTTRQSAPSTRALGWDTPGPNSSAGPYFSRDSFGHTGFTGTSLWLDRARDLFIVLLTNRVNPTRDNRKHVDLRRAVHNTVQRSLMDVRVEEGGTGEHGGPGEPGAVERDARGTG